MRPDILIVGQGLAGTLLGWEFERAGISFAIADGGHTAAATSIAAGLINPITGRRFVKSWRYETLFPAAQATYRELESELGVSLWREMRLRRTFVDERERSIATAKRADPELARFIETADDSGWWIRGAARVDLPMLLETTRARWISAGRLRPENVDPGREAERHELVIDCRGVAGTKYPQFDFVGWEYSKGEILALLIDGLEPDVILHRRFWVVPLGPGTALAGATHQLGVRDAEPSEAARGEIETAAREILGPGRPFVVKGHRAGIRVNLPNKRPVAGRHPTDRRFGLVNALGAKGGLWAPMLARQWVLHLTQGVPFDAEIDVRRFLDVRLRSN